MLVKLFLLFNHSTAILRYLTARDNVAEHWYPVELQNRAKVDEYLAWQQCHVNQVTDGIYTQQVHLAIMLWWKNTNILNGVNIFICHFH